MTTCMKDAVKKIGNDKFHVSSERNESLSQEIKYEVYFGDESNYCYCSCGSFRKEIGCMQKLLYCYQKSVEIL